MTLFRGLFCHLRILQWWIQWVIYSVWGLTITRIYSLSKRRKKVNLKNHSSIPRKMFNGGRLTSQRSRYKDWAVVWMMMLESTKM